MSTKMHLSQLMRRVRTGMVAAGLGTLPLLSIACVGEVDEGAGIVEEEQVGEVEQAWLAEDQQFDIEGGCSNAEIRSCVKHCGGTVHSCTRYPINTYACECDGNVVLVHGGGEY